MQATTTAENWAESRGHLSSPTKKHITTNKATLRHDNIMNHIHITHCNYWTDKVHNGNVRHHREVCGALDQQRYNHLNKRSE